MTGACRNTFPKPLCNYNLELILLILLVLHSCTHVRPAPTDPEHATPEAGCRMNAPIKARSPTLYVSAQYLFELSALAYDLQYCCELLILWLTRSLALLLELLQMVVVNRALLSLA